MQESDEHVERHRPSTSLLVETPMPAFNIIVGPHLLAVAGEVGGVHVLFPAMSTAPSPAAGRLPWHWSAR